MTASSATSNYICSENEFFASDYGKKKIAVIIEQLKKNYIIAEPSNFSMKNLQNYYVKNTPIINNYVYNCYEQLLNYGYEGTAKELLTYKQTSKPVLLKTVDTVGNIGDRLNSYTNDALQFISDSFDKIKNGLASTLDYLIIGIVIIAGAVGIYLLTNLYKELK